MCWPSCKGGAYLAVSVFIYRSVLVVVTMISSSVTRLKSTYLPLTVMEELLLSLLYFIPLFTSAAFVLIGLESNSLEYVVHATLALATTLFVRYTSELAFIYGVNWGAYRIKTPQLYLNLAIDLTLLTVLLLYARGRLRVVRTVAWGTPQKGREVMEGEQLVQIHNDLTPREQSGCGCPCHSQKSEKNVNVGREGLGQGVGEGVALHYPSILPVDPQRRLRPLPPLPQDEMDDISLPPPVPLVGPEDI